MKIADHVNRSEKIAGIRAEDIHKWIDGYFDPDNFSLYLRSQTGAGFNPYNHRKFRHCVEVLEDAYKEFEHKYSREQIKAVFESHLRDDYDGYLPKRQDFINGTFNEKYHEDSDPIRENRVLDREELTEYFKGRFYANKHQKDTGTLTRFFVQIILPTGLAVILFISAIFVFIIPKFYDTILDRKKEMIAELTISAVSIIEQYIEKEKQGELSLRQAQVSAAEKIRKMRYGKEKKDYFWITNMLPRMIMHPYRIDLEQQDLSHYSDSYNSNLFAEAVTIVQEKNEGFIEYFWQWKDNPDRVAPKLSYVRGIPDWQWIIGTGIYLDDVHQQTKQIVNHIIRIFIGIAMILVLILLYIIVQSLKIEKQRAMAVAGLVESKDRYRALAEASKEGFILELGKRHIYFNDTLKKMLGYNDEELQDISIWDIIIPDTAANQDVKAYFERVFNQELEPQAFEAQLKTKYGIIFDGIISVSRIFFSKKSGHLINIRQITNFKTNMLPLKDVQSFTVSQKTELLNEIRNSKSVGHVILILNQISHIVREMLSQNSDINSIRALIGDAHAASLAQFAQMAIQNLGAPPVEFAFVSLGSAARQEMTMFSDQDNAIMFTNGNPGQLEKNRNYFIHLADIVNTHLYKAGYDYCPGGIMGINPKWCLSVQEWERLYQRCIRDPDASRLETDIIFDAHIIYGNEQLWDNIQTYAFDLLAASSGFFAYYATHCLSYSPPSIFMNKLRESFNVKDCLLPIVNYARLYSLKYKLKPISTVGRLKAIHDAGMLQKEAFESVMSGFDFLWYLRFHHQMMCHANLSKINNTIQLNKLQKQDLETLNHTIKTISVLQSQINYDFLGRVI